MIKIISIIFFCVVGIIQAKEIYVSENFIEHDCNDIKKVTITSIGGSKDILLAKLKRKAIILGGNSVIKVKYHSGFFNNKYDISGVVSNCDIDNSPGFFLKAPLLNEKSKMFGVIAVSKETVNISKTYSNDEIKSSDGILAKLGFQDKDFRYYLSINSGLGFSLLASSDYMLPLNSRVELFTGLSCGEAEYNLGSSDNLSSKVLGVQFGLKYKDFEIELKYLQGLDSQFINNIEYKINNISLLSIGYSF